MSEVAAAFVSVAPSMKNFGRTVVTEATRSGDLAGRSSGRRFGEVFAKSTIGPLRTFGALAGGIFAAKKIKDFFGSAIAEARESQKVSALTAQVIKSTGGAAQISAKQVGALATAISNKVGVDDEAIQSGANLLLTFKGIRNEAGAGNDIFNQTTQIMTDMTAAMNHGTVTTEGLKGSAIQLGKALNDPVKGMTALTRVGVTFTDQQKKQVAALEAAGKHMQAQKIILRELKSEFGGAAAASTTAGQKLSVVWKNTEEDVGKFLLPALDKAEKGLAKALPKIEAGTKAIAHVIASQIFPKVKDITGRAVGFGAGVVSAVKTAVKTGDWKSLGSSLGASIGTALKAAFSGGGGLLSHLVDWAKGVDWGGLGIKVGKGAVSFVTGFVVGFLANLPAILSTLAAHWQDAILAALAVIPIGRVASVLGKAVEGIPILRIFSPLLRGVGRLGGWMEEAFSKTLGRAFRFLGRAIANGFDETAGTTVSAARRFVSNVVTHLYVWADDFAKAGLRLLQGLGRGIMRGFDAVGRWLGRLGGRIVKAVGDLSHLLYDVGRQIVGGLWDGVKAAWGGFVGKLHGLVSHIPFVHGSPSLNEMAPGLLSNVGATIVRGLGAGVQGEWPAVVAILHNAGKAIPETVAAGIKAAKGVLQNELSNLLGKRKDFASTVASGVSAFDLSSLSHPTADSIAAYLNKRDRQARRERKLGKSLIKAGLPEALIEEIESSNDPATALRLLQAIAGGDKTTIANIGGAFSSLQQTGRKAGREQAREVYDPQIKEVRAELAALRHAVEKVGGDVADAMNGVIGSAKHKGRAKASS